MLLESHISDAKIAEYTGICPRMMRGLCKQFQETGEIVRKPVMNGCPRLLSSLDAMVSASYYMLLHLLKSYSS